jgi:hypothetical protein
MTVDQQTRTNSLFPGSHHFGFVYVYDSAHPQRHHNKRQLSSLEGALGAGRNQTRHFMKYRWG